MEQTLVSSFSQALQEKNNMSTAPSREISEIAWEKLQPFTPDASLVARNRIVTVNRSDTAHSAFDMMRTRILQNMRENSWTSVAITSPTPGCGKTFTALNLAFSLANQKDCRTVLLDLDMKRPQVGKTLGMRDAASMESFLRGELQADDIFRRHGDNLAIAANKQSVQFSAELLQSAASTQALQDMRRRMRPDIVIYDLPPMLSTDDVLAFLPNVDCIILVAAAEQSTLSEIDICEQTLTEKTNVLGVVLNKCKFSAEKYGY